MVSLNSELRLPVIYNKNMSVKEQIYILIRANLAT